MLNLKRKFASHQSTNEGTVPLPFRGKRVGNRSHNLGKALGEGFGHKFSDRRMDVKTERRFFCVRCRRTYVLNKSESKIYTLLNMYYDFIIFNKRLNSFMS